MKKPLLFYLLFIAGVALIIGACVMLGFIIYYIAIGATLNTLGLAISFPIVAGIGIALLCYALKMLKSINTVSTLISLYPDFIKTDSMEISSHPFSRSQLLIDGIHRVFIFLLKGQIVPAYSFDSIISYTVYENGVNVFERTRDNIDKDRFLGHVGTRGGNLMSDYVSDLHLAIKVNDPQCPDLVISFLGIRGVDRLSVDYRDLISTINKLCAKIDKMISL
ncbi:MAG: hypothetical protein J6C23_08475 [Clostridia bacterium]|nr:hypothetical protein [Clostridia bacterium]